MPRLNAAGADDRMAPRGRPQPPRWTTRQSLRLACAAVLVGSMLAGGYWLSVSGTADRLLGRAWDAAIKISVEAGLRLTEITVEGRRHSSRAALQRAIGLRRGSAMLTVSADKVRRAIEALPWVAEARVRKALPGTVHIRLTERQPAALWQHEGELRLIDSQGAVLTERALGRFSELPIVIGSVAYERPLHANSADRLCIPDPANSMARCHRAPAFARALNQINDSAEIANRVHALRWMGQRRWDLHFHNGTVIKLPAKGMVGALARLDSLQRSDGLLDRAVAMIDLRLDDRLIVRPRTDIALSVRPVPEEEI